MRIQAERQGKSRWATLAKSPGEGKPAEVLRKLGARRGRVKSIGHFAR